MRALGGAVSVLILGACSGSDATVGPGAGGSATSTGGTEQGSGGVASGGAETTTGGNSVGTGGVESSDGGTASGATSAVGGSGGSAAGGSGGEGVGGNPATGGSLPVLGECGGEYDACGCGCCDAEPMITTCYYPELGIDLAAVMEEDAEVAMSAECATAGCSLGERYVCCTAEGSETDGTYEFSAWGDSIGHLLFERTGTEGRCTTLHIQGPRENVETPFPIELPPYYFIFQAADGPCEESGDGREAIGAVGSIFSCDGMDVTLFFEAEDGSVDTVRFHDPDLWLDGYSPEECRPEN